MKKSSLLLLLLLAGCAPESQRQLSAGRLGCPVQEINISDVDSTRHTKTWSASCRGQNYFCSSTDDFLDVVCKPEMKAAIAPAANPAPAPAPAPVADAPPAAPVGDAAPDASDAAPAAPDATTPK